MLLPAPDDKEFTCKQDCLGKLLFSKWNNSIAPAGLDWDRLINVMEEQHLGAYYYALRSTFGLTLRTSGIEVIVLKGRAFIQTI